MEKFDEFKYLRKVAGIDENEFQKNKINEDISDLTTRTHPNEQNEVVKRYLEKLHSFEETNTDDVEDFKNLLEAIIIYKEELIKKIISLQKNFNRP